jgi:hypothetical protein
MRGGPALGPARPRCAARCVAAFPSRGCQSFRPRRAGTTSPAGSWRRIARRHQLVAVALATSSARSAPLGACPRPRPRAAGARTARRGGRAGEAVLEVVAAEPGAALGLAGDGGRGRGARTASFGPPAAASTGRRWSPPRAHSPPRSGRCSITFAPSRPAQERGLDAGERPSHRRAAHGRPDTAERVTGLG